jgi:hypothetical protein
MWLTILTVCLLALTVVVHFLPMPVPAARPPVPANGIVVPSSDTPTLTASLALPEGARASAV